jgi:hypothetical protein
MAAAACWSAVLQISPVNAAPPRLHTAAGQPTSLRRSAQSSTALQQAGTLAGSRRLQTPSLKVGATCKGQHGPCEAQHSTAQHIGGTTS